MPIDTTKNERTSSNLSGHTRTYEDHEHQRGHSLFKVVQTNNRSRVNKSETIQQDSITIEAYQHHWQVLLLAVQVITNKVTSQDANKQNESSSNVSNVAPST